MSRLLTLTYGLTILSAPIWLLLAIQEMVR